MTEETGLRRPITRIEKNITYEDDTGRRNPAFAFTLWCNPTETVRKLTFFISLQLMNQTFRQFLTK